MDHFDGDNLVRFAVGDCFVDDTNVANVDCEDIHGDLVNDLEFHDHFGSDTDHVLFVDGAVER